MNKENVIIDKFSVSKMFNTILLLNTIMQSKKRRLAFLALFAPILMLTVFHAAPSSAQSIFLTCHDPDFHATIGGNTAGAISINSIAVDFVMDPAFNPFVEAGATKFLLVTSVIEPPTGHASSLDGLVASGFVEGTDFDTADATSLDTALDELGTTYSAIVVASDFGGILTQAELDILNARADDIQAFLDAGGGIYAMAESNGGAGLTPDGGHFEFLGLGAISTQSNITETGFTLTPFGEELGLTDEDINGNASHCIFNEAFDLEIVDVNANEEIISLAQRTSPDATPTPTPTPTPAPLDCSTAVPSVDTIWPPFKQLVDVNIEGVVDAEGNAASIIIDSVSQDESTHGILGVFCPDAGGIGTDTAQIRAERDGRGNGRVYHIGFTAQNESGATCTGEVTVCVPHDQGNGSECGDDEELVDSTVCE